MPLLDLINENSSTQKKVTIQRGKIFCLDLTSNDDIVKDISVGDEIERGEDKMVDFLQKLLEIVPKSQHS